MGETLAMVAIYAFMVAAALTPLAGYLLARRQAYLRAKAKYEAALLEKEMG